VWVLEVESGKAKVAGQDPWMMPQRTLAPAWSSDSKSVAYASRFRSPDRATLVMNVDTSDVKQVTDGLAAAICPVFDASGKYLSFLASTDFGRRLRWLDVSNRRLVDRLSGVQFTHAYMPSTGQPGCTSFNRDDFAQEDERGAVIDERVNGGGLAADYSSRDTIARFWSFRIGFPSGVYM
jgi:tricorn protease